MPRTQKATGKGRTHTAAEKRRIRDGLRERLAELHAEMADTSAVTHDLRSGEPSSDEADAAANVTGHEQESAVAKGLQRRIDQVEHALARLSQGDYGRCEECGGAIPARRLVAFPAVTLCVECKQSQERR